MVDGCSNKDVDYPRLLDLIPKNRGWVVQKGGDERRHGPSSEEKKLELRLGPPGEEEREYSILSLGYFSNNMPKNGWMMNGSDGCQNQTQTQNQNPNQNQFSYPKFPFYMVKESSSQPCGSKAAEGLQKDGEKKAFSPAPAADPAVPTTNSSQKRTAPASVVGWPPVRSFRKNLASSSSSKPMLESQNEAPNKVLIETPAESCQKGYFVKINMDGIPIGRKVDLKAHDSYEKLSSSVDELFRGLLAAQMDSSSGGIQNKQEGEKVIKDILDGSGEYTLVYEDNEGDRMLVGDVPWHMFVSTVKRLRVLKTSELSTMRFGGKQGKTPRA